MKGRLLLILPVLLVAGVVAAVLVGVLRTSTAGPGPSDVLSVLKSDAEAVDLRSGQMARYQSNSIREVGMWGDVTFLAAASLEDEICLLAWRKDAAGKAGAWETATSCTPVAQFAIQGASLGVTSPDAPDLLAYLLPDGYEDAASAVPWGTVLGPNLLVVTDLTAHSEVQASIALEAFERGAFELELLLLPSAAN